MSELSGQNWKVERGFIEREQARVVDSQARVLKSMNPHYVRGYMPANQETGRTGLTVLKVALKEMGASDRHTFGELIEVARIVTEAADDIADRKHASGEPDIFLNFYKSGASTGEHRDSYTPATVAVGLSGLADLYVAENGSGKTRLPLYETDAFCLDNTVDIEQRPIHHVVCRGDIPRIAIVNANK